MSSSIRATFCTSAVKSPVIVDNAWADWFACFSAQTMASSILSTSCWSNPPISIVFFCMCQSQHLAPLAAIIGDVSTHDVQLVVQAHEGLLYVTHIGRMHNIILSKLPAHARHCSFVVGKKVLNIHGCPPTLAVHPNNLGELVVEDELLEGLWRAQALHHTINKVAEGDLSMPQDVQAVKEELTISISALCLTFVFDDFKVRRRCVLHEISLQLFPGLLAENMQCIF
mmetsp:Transcript_15933/g.35694  ORF Transcript_15933/g.35694 Transcript_15933/m.35694 type:complete len:227 (-) Transcript_15933:1124-1804(-)